MFSASVDLAPMIAALRERKAAVAVATREAQREAAHTVEAGIKLRLSTSAHPAGTSTPAPPGAPPSVVTGTLRRSIRVSRLRSLGPHRSEISVGPTVIYARIQELGGVIVPKRAARLSFRIDGAFVSVTRVDLPARPYVKPTVEAYQRDGRLLRIYRSHWARALKGEVR